MDSRLVTYAVWFWIRRSRHRKIRQSLQLLAMHLYSVPRWRLQPHNTMAEVPSTLHLKIGEAFWLVHIEQHCSPGDICGTLKHHVLDPGDKVVAVQSDPQRYVPHQGVCDDPGLIAEWSRFLSIPSSYYLEKIAGGD